MSSSENPFDSLQNALAHQVKTVSVLAIESIRLCLHILNDNEVNEPR